MQQDTKHTTKYNHAVVDRLAAKYGLTKDFIRKSLSGARTSETSDTIKKDYNDLVKKMNDALK